MVEKIIKDFNEGISSGISLATILKIAVVVVVVFFVLVILFGSWFTVSAGHRGVVLRFGAVQPGVYTEGIHIKIPWIDSVVKMNVQIQKAEAEASAASKDLQIVHTKVVTNYEVKSDAVDTLYQNIGRDYEEKVIDPAVQEIVKAVTAKYTAEELITKRADVKEGIKANLASRLSQYYIQLVDISIADFNFSHDFNAAIEAKQVAEQQVAKAKNELERIKVEAEQKVASAKAEAESLKLQKQEITSQLIELRKTENEKRAIEKWNGELPTYIGSGIIPFIELKTK